MSERSLPTCPVCQLDYKLAIRARSDRLLAKCEAGCAQSRLLKALWARGIWLGPSRRPSPPARMPTERFKHLVHLVGRKRLLVGQRPMPFHNREWKLSLALLQPTDEALRFLDLFAGAKQLVNATEFALDLVAGGAAECRALGDFIVMHQERRMAWKTCKAGPAGETSYLSVRRGVGNNLAVYGDRPSKVTGQLFNLHVEWRANGVGAVRAAGIERLRDLIGFDHRAFWQQRLRLFEVDRGRLGRIVTRSTRRGAWVATDWQGNRYDRDAWGGLVVLHAAQEEALPLGAVEGLRRWGERHRIDVRSALVKLPNDALLPANPG